jgi:hypothetical protein
VQIVAFAREDGRMTMGNAIKLTGAIPNTLKLHFRKLTEGGNLNQRGRGLVSGMNGNRKGCSMHT